jgi:hypothetical protein
MKYADVREAVREYMAGLESGESTTIYVQIPLADKFGIDIAPNNWSGYYTSDGRTFMGQVSRALNQLAGEGYLVKDIRYTVGRKREAFWTRRDVAEARQRDREARNAREAIKQADHAALARRFDAAGYTVTTSRDGSVTFTPYDTRRVLNLLEREARS